MLKTKTLAKQTRNNWGIDVTLFLSIVLSVITGIYFLFLPVSGYQGGRNPMYGVTILFERATWEDLHTWFGIAMIVVAAIHVAIHWDWIAGMTKRALHEITRREGRLNVRSRFNLGINVLIGLSFLLTALSGIYLLFSPGGGHADPAPIFLFTRTTWDLIHTWAGIVLIEAAMLHFAIHWGWVVKVTGKILRTKPVSSKNLPSSVVEA